MSTGLVVALLSAGIMVIVMIVAYLNGTLLPSQQLNKVWLPVIANGAVWANLAIVSFCLLPIIMRYEDRWGDEEKIVALIVGMVISWTLWYLVYRNGKYDDGLTHPLSIAGAIFLLYGGVIYAIIGLFYFCSQPIRTMDVILTGMSLILYIPIANHVPLNFIRTWSFMPWCPWIFAEETSPMLFIIVGEAAVILMTITKLL